MDDPITYCRSRRAILSSIGSGGLAATTGLSGCMREGDDDRDLDPVENRVSVDPADITEGGTFRTAIQAQPDSFDYPYSNSTYAVVLSNLLYEGMITTDASGEIYPWLATEYERMDVQDVGPADYDSYMVEVPWEQDDDGNYYPASDSQIVLTHPDNDPESGDRARVLTTDEAPAAVDDDVYGMHFRFQLHEGVRFHGGQELTAEDVVSSYERVEGSKLSGQLFDSILTIRSDGDYTIDLYVQEPDAAAVRELGGWPIYPTDKAELPASEMDPRHGNTPVGTGPWVLDEFENESYAVFARNDDYWFETDLKDWFDGDESFPDGPVIDEIDVRFVSDSSQRSAALQNGELDMAFGLNTDSLNDYQTSEGYRVAATEGAGYSFLQYPVRVAPWDDARVRRAVNHLIPREDLSEEIFSGWENPAWVPLPPVAAKEGATDYDQMVDDLRHFNEYDPERSDELLQEAVDDRDIETPIEVVIETNSDDENRRRACQLVTESLNQSEFFDATLELVGDVTTAALRYMDREYHEKGNLVWISLSAGFNPHDYAKAVHHPDNFEQCCNFQNIDDQELNELLRQARYGTDVVEDPGLRRERYEDVWERVLELNANSYGTHSMVVGVVNDTDVHGFNTYPSEQDILGYGLYSPMDEQITYLDRE